MNALSPWPFKAGDRIRHSALWINQQYRPVDRVRAEARRGIFIRVNSSQIATVLWDGNHTTSHFHQDFLVLDEKQHATILQAIEQSQSSFAPPLNEADGWTSRRIELLKKLWEDGLSASKICEELGSGFTRSAVLGKVHRLGLSGRVKVVTTCEPKAKAPKKVRSRVTEPRRAPLPRPAIVVAPVIPEGPIESLLIPLWEIKEGQCRWPIGDPRDVEAFRFCGLPTQDEKCWCPSHWPVGREGSQRRAVHNPLGITKAPRVFLDTSKDREEAA